MDKYVDILEKIQTSKTNQYLNGVDVVICELKEKKEIITLTEFNGNNNLDITKYGFANFCFGNVKGCDIEYVKLLIGNNTIDCYYPNLKYYLKGGNDELKEIPFYATSNKNFIPALKYNPIQVEIKFKNTYNPKPNKPYLFMYEYVQISTDYNDNKLHEELIVINNYINLPRLDYDNLNNKIRTELNMPVKLIEIDTDYDVDSISLFSPQLENIKFNFNYNQITYKYECYISDCLTELRKNKNIDFETYEKLKIIKDNNINFSKIDCYLDIKRNTFDYDQHELILKYQTYNIMHYSKGFGVLYYV